MASRFDTTQIGPLPGIQSLDTLLLNTKPPSVRVPAVGNLPPQTAGMQEFNAGPAAPTGGGSGLAALFQLLGLGASAGIGAAAGGGLGALTGLGAGLKGLNVAREQQREEEARRDANRARILNQALALEDQSPGAGVTLLTGMGSLNGEIVPEEDIRWLKDYSQQNQTRRQQEATAKAEAERKARIFQTDEEIRKATAVEAGKPKGRRTQVVNGQLLDLDTGEVIQTPGLRPEAKEPKTQIVDGQLVDLGTGKAKPIQGLAPKPQEAFKPTGEAMTKANMLRAANSHIDELVKMLDDPKVGPVLEKSLGPWSGRWMEWSTTTFGDEETPPDVITFQSLLKNAVDLQLRARTGANAPQDEKATFDIIMGSTKFSAKGTRNRLKTTQAANEREVKVIYTPPTGGAGGNTTETPDYRGMSDKEVAERALKEEPGAVAEARKRGLI